MYFVFRTPSTMEDAGRYEYMGKFDNYDDAMDFIDAYTKQLEGYYSRSSFIVAKETNGG